MKMFHVKQFQQIRRSLLLASSGGGLPYGADKMFHVKHFLASLKTVLLHFARSSSKEGLVPSYCDRQPEGRRWENYDDRQSGRLIGCGGEANPCH